MTPIIQKRNKTIERKRLYKIDRLLAIQKAKEAKKSTQTLKKTLLKEMANFGEKTEISCD